MEIDWITMLIITFISVSIALLFARIVNILGYVANIFNRQTTGDMMGATAGVLFFFSSALGLVGILFWVSEGAILVASVLLISAYIVIVLCLSFVICQHKGILKMEGRTEDTIGAEIYVLFFPSSALGLVGILFWVNECSILVASILLILAFILIVLFLIYQCKRIAKRENIIGSIKRVFLFLFFFLFLFLSLALGLVGILFLVNECSILIASVLLTSSAFIVIALFLIFVICQHKGIVKKKIEQRNSKKENRTA